MRSGPYTPSVIRVAIVEDNDVLREALEILLRLSGDIDVVATAADGRAGLAACAEARPDVIVLDYRLPDVDGVETARSIRDRCPDSAIVALTAAAEGPQVEALLAAGAVACLTKDRELDEIVTAVRDAHRADADAR
jgi:DNA-binding NarL/FixJ family response regulator